MVLAVFSAAVFFLLCAETQSDKEERVSRVIEQRGRNCQPDIPYLIDYLGNEDWGFAGLAAHSLALIGSDAVPALTVRLKSANPIVRQAAANALGEIGPGAAKAIPLLRQLLNDDDEFVRRCARQAVGRIGRRY